MSESTKEQKPGKDPWIEEAKGYGLKYLPNRAEKGGVDHDRGIVTDGQGNYFRILDFEREQNRGLDTDQGIQELEGTLYRDARQYDYDVTNWNTAGDVQGALETLAANFESIDEVAADQVDSEPYVPSEEIESANQMVGNWEQSILDGSFSEAVFGNGADKRAAGIAGLAAAQVDDSPQARNAVFDAYKLNLAKDLRPSIQSLLNADLVVKGGPMKSSSGADPQTQFPGPAGAAGSDSWVWNQ